MTAQTQLIPRERLLSQKGDGLTRLQIIAGSKWALAASDVRCALPADYAWILNAYAARLSEALFVK